MTKNELIQSLKNTFEDCVKIAEAKNADYADGDDAFKNFNNAKLVGVDPARGILIRMTDKLSRISNLLDKPASVKDEKLEDTLNDIINYSAILKAYLEEIKNSKAYLSNKDATTTLPFNPYLNFSNTNTTNTTNTTVGIVR